MEKVDNHEVLGDVAEYYSHKLKLFGETAKGVDWNGEETQHIRFKQLSSIIDHTRQSFSLVDFGCGYGALLDYLNNNDALISYTGIDICETMISSALKRYKYDKRAKFINSIKPQTISNYAIASGIFNVKLSCSDEVWFEHVISTLDAMNRASKDAFSFNCLTTYSDKECMREDLYYADPARLFEWCKSQYSRNVALLHDYDLYEFTILVRKL